MMSFERTMGGGHALEPPRAGRTPTDAGGGAPAALRLGRTQEPVQTLTSDSSLVPEPRYAFRRMSPVAAAGVPGGRFRRLSAWGGVG
jgi:hypothetical protein